jgi:hypothetical protein
VFVSEHFYCRIFCKPFIGNALANGITVDLENGSFGGGRVLNPANVAF